MGRNYHAGATEGSVVVAKVVAGIALVVGTSTEISCCCDGTSLDSSLRLVAFQDAPLQVRSELSSPDRRQLK